MASDGVISQLSSVDMVAPQSADINSLSQVTWAYNDLQINDHRIVMWENAQTSFVTFGSGARLNAVVRKREYS